MAYQTPELLLVGAASNLVQGVNGCAGEPSDATCADNKGLDFTSDQAELW